MFLFGLKFGTTLSGSTKWKPSEALGEALAKPRGQI